MLIAFTSYFKSDLHLTASVYQFLKKTSICQLIQNRGYSPKNLKLDLLEFNDLYFTIKN